MNYVACLNTVICESCGGECSRDEMSDDHAGLCRVCGDDLQASLDAEESEEILSDDQIVATLLEAS